MALNRTRVAKVSVAKLTRRERAELRKRPPPPRKPVVAKSTKPTRRERGKLRGRVKRTLGLNRSECGAIGAGHRGPSRYAGRSLEERYDEQLEAAGLKPPRRGWAAIGPVP